MVARIVLTFSLLAAFLGIACAQNAISPADHLRSRPNDAYEIVQAHPEWEHDPDLKPIVDDILSIPGADHTDEAKELAACLEMRQAFLETASSGSAAEQAKSIKSSIGYRDASLDQESNWLGRALARLKNLIPKFNSPTPDALPGALALGDWVTFACWLLLGAGVVALAYFGARHFAWKQGLARRAKAMLEEDEPERTLDEWLEQADALARDGKHREAVRALYLACLLRFDEHRVARFVRAETNWEHLARIQNSPNLPPELDFRPATLAFDRVWYGFRVRGQQDVDEFRAWYQAITEMLGRRAA